MPFQRLRCLVWKEFLELRQNPRLFGNVIVAADQLKTFQDARAARWRAQRGRISKIVYHHHFTVGFAHAALQ